MLHMIDRHTGHTMLYHLRVALRPCRASAGPVLAVLALSLAFVGCAPKTVNRPPSSRPAPMYAGPAYLRGTVGSMATLRNYEPILVSNYGLVVGLDGTGSSEVPAFLRQQMINEMQKMGIGSTRTRQQLPDELHDFARMSAEEVLADPRTAVVAVQGLMPAGAVRGTRFDVLVSALPQTQTTSLAGGTLWTTELAVEGANPSLPFSRTRAAAQGPIYINPFDEDDDEARHDHMRQAVVVAGGSVSLPQQLELILNQPSWNRSREIADRINERFRAAPGERIQTAEAQTDVTIRINVPRRFAGQPHALIELIAHLYVQRGPEFEVQQAERLARDLREEPERSRAVVLAWRALGKTTLPVLQDYYEDEQLHMRLASLEAGAWLGDERAARGLAALADHDEADVRQRVAEALVLLPRSTVGSRVLRELLDDEQAAVRIAAYESLAANNSPIIDRQVMRRNDKIKFIIDRVPADRPMVYISQKGYPRLVIFDEQLGFRTPMFAQMWDARLIMRIAATDEDAEAEADVDADADAVDAADADAADGDAADILSPLKVYYQEPGRIEGSTFDVWPSVAALAYVLAQAPSVENPQEGLDLTYSEVIETIYRMCEAGDIPAPVEVNVSPLAQRVADYESQVDDLRPEVGDTLPPEPVFGADPVIGGDEDGPVPADPWADGPTFRRESGDANEPREPRSNGSTPDELLLVPDGDSPVPVQ